MCAVGYGGAGGVLSHSTAAALAGLRVQATAADSGLTAPVHLTVPADRPVAPQPGLAIHRSRLLTAADVHPLRLPPRVRIEPAVLEMAASALSVDDAVAVVAAVVQQRLSSVDRLRAALLRLGPLPRRQLRRS